MIPETNNPELEMRLKTGSMAWHLDVRGLQPPAPMMLTLKVIESLPQGVSLVQINERIPQFLFPILLERGFRYDIIQDKGSEVRVEIMYAALYPGA